MKKLMISTIGILVAGATPLVVTNVLAKGDSSGCGVGAQENCAVEYGVNCRGSSSKPGPGSGSTNANCGTSSGSLNGCGNGIDTTLGD